LAHAERGSALAREEKFTEALDHLNQAYAIYSSQGIQRSMGYNLENRGEVLSRLGRFDEAKVLLAQANAIATKPGGELKRLSVEGDLALAAIALMQDNFPNAKALAQKAAAAAGTEFKTVAADAKIVIALAETYTGAKAVGQKGMVEAVDLAKQLNDPARLATALLAQAAVALLSGDSTAASSNALQAEEVFARLGQSASQWQALLIAGQASQTMGDKNRAREYAMRAKDTLTKLEQRWGSENYRSYLSRPDIQRSIKQLEQLTGSV